MNLSLMQKLKPLIIATLIIVIITIATRLFNLDILISHVFYVAGEGFPHKQDLLVRFFYNSIPVSVVLSILFVIMFPIVAYKKSQLRIYNRLVLAFFLAMVVGPGLIVNSLFKDNFGRPRPIQSTEFGGQYQGRAVLEANWGNKGKSFPSGHASIPLAFLVLAFAARRRGHLKLAKQLTVAIVTWYFLVCYARIAAGGHHFSDVCWAGYFAFISAWLSYLFIDKVVKK